MYPHRIRLRHPWQSQSEADGIRRYQRRFGLPRTLDADERVVLVCHSPGLRAAWLNDVALTPAPATNEFDVRALLRDRNELTLAIAEPEPLGEVALEIRAGALLRDVRVSSEADGWRVTGRVEGTAERPLDLYVLADRHTLAQTAIEPTPAGQPFSLLVERGTASELRVELVNGSVVWYTVEQACPSDT